MQYLGQPEQVENDTTTVQNCYVTCSDGIRLTGQHWTNCKPRTARSGLVLRVLCWHGFLDNCRSFSALAPRLLASESSSIGEVVAMDFPGHGQSHHKSLDHPPYEVISDIVFYIAQVVQILDWKDGFILIGHSMGAMACIMYAGAFPERIHQLILLDGFGPEFERPSCVVHRLRDHVTKRYAANASFVKTKRTYSTLDDAISTRQQTAVKSPGKQWLSYAAAKEMVVWALERTKRDSDDNNEGWRFRHDPRLYWPALQAHTLDQAFDFWKSLRDHQVPTLWLRADDGWPFSKKWLDRAETFLGSLGIVKTLPGSHHFHADPETVGVVTETILEHLTVKHIRSEIQD